MGALIYLFLFYTIHTSYISAKYSDFPKMKKYSDFPGYNRKMPCRHVYEYVHHETCPDCGRYTHEPDLDLSHKLFVAKIIYFSVGV